MERVSEDSLPVDISLNFEHKLSTSHAIRDLERIPENSCVLVHQIKTEQESLLLQVLILLEHEVGDLSVLVLGLVFYRKDLCALTIELVDLGLTGDEGVCERKSVVHGDGLLRCPG